MRLIRWFLAAIILFVNAITSPRGMKRDAESQAIIDAKTERLTLYQYLACPFCVKVRRAMKRNGLNIKTLDAKRSEQSRNELLAGGGVLKVPCLKIEEPNGDVTWMYESDDIVEYLENSVLT